MRGRRGRSDLSLKSIYALCRSKSTKEEKKYNFIHNNKGRGMEDW